MSAIQADIEAEAARLLSLAEREAVPIRLVGGLAIKRRAGGALPDCLARPYKDIDFVAAKGSSGAAQKFFDRAGYTPHKAFNALNGNERLLFFDDPNERQVDVFVGSFSMSHKVPLEGRVDLESETLPVAELLLTKLQIAELNEKDVRDALALFVTHPVAEEDGEALNAGRVAECCASDWGLWRTITGNLETTRDYVDRYELSGEEKETARARIEELLSRIEDEPKTRGWRIRAKVGERKRWYEVPEEVAGGP